jgi:fluoroacetyl-CoA thioesterase
MKKLELAVGTRGTATSIVEDADLADKVGLSAGDTFPAVYATSRMIALMELAAARAMMPALGAGENSVGVTVDIEHTRPTPPGARVTAEAHYLGRHGKLYLFEVLARDDAGPIGRGRHKRAVVDPNRLEESAAQRRSSG